MSAKQTKEESKSTTTAQDPSKDLPKAQAPKTKKIGNKSLGYYEIVEGEQSAEFAYVECEQVEFAEGEKISESKMLTFRLTEWEQFLSHGEGQNWTIVKIWFMPAKWDTFKSFDDFFDHVAKEEEAKRQAAIEEAKKRQGGKKRRTRTFGF